MRQIEIAIKAAVDAAKAALKENFEQQLDEMAQTFDTALNKVKIQIGDPYISLSNVNPSTTLGYGTWMLISKGCAIVGLSDVPSDPDWTKTVGGTFGSFEHVLVQGQLPKINVKAVKLQSRHWQYGSEKCPDEGFIPNWDEGNSMSGNDEPHNKVQPSMVFAIWKRTA